MCINVSVCVYQAVTCKLSGEVVQNKYGAEIAGGVRKQDAATLVSHTYSHCLLIHNRKFNSKESAASTKQPHLACSLAAFQDTNRSQQTQTMWKHTDAAPWSRDRRGSSTSSASLKGSSVLEGVNKASPGASGFRCLVGVCVYKHVNVHHPVDR